MSFLISLCATIKLGVLQNFAIYTGKQLRWSLFLVKLLAFSPATLLKRDSSTEVFLWIYVNFFSPSAVDASEKRISTDVARLPQASNMERLATKTIQNKKSLIQTKKPKAKSINFQTNWPRSHETFKVLTLSSKACNDDVKVS